MSTEPGLPDVPIWQRSFLPQDGPAAPPSAPAAPLVAPPPAAAPLGALPPPSGPAYGAPGYTAPAQAAPPSAYPPAYAAASAAPVAPNRFGIVPDPAYDVAPPPPPPGAGGYGGGWGAPPAPWTATASGPTVYETPKSVITCGRWGRARGILGVLINGLLLVVTLGAPSSRAAASVSSAILITAVVSLVVYVLWLYAGQQTVHGDRGAAKLLRILAVADLGVVALLMALGISSVLVGAIGSMLDIYLVVTLFGSTATRWMGNGR